MKLHKLMKNIYNSTIVADKGYMLLFESKGCEVVIPSKSEELL
ncbi:hypothetical protein [Wolbachia endosymbiont of Rhagoletis cingulata]